MTADLQALLEKLEGARGPDREIDCLIHEWQNPHLTAAMRGYYYGDFTGEYFEPEARHPGDYLTHRASSYSATLDASLALVERVLPGWKWSITFGYADSDGGPFYARVNEGRSLRDYEPCPGPTPALALLAALLKALIAKEQS